MIPLRAPSSNGAAARAIPTAWPTTRRDGTLDTYTTLFTWGEDAREVHRGIDGMCLDVDGNIIACTGTFYLTTVAGHLSKAETDRTGWKMFGQDKK